MGFEHNWGAAYIPFNITNHHGRDVPACYIQVHMNTDDPYVLVHAMLTGTTYGGQLHTTPVNDLNTPVEPLTDVAMRMFPEDYPGCQHVNKAVSSINDCTLIAELKRYWYKCRQIEEARLEHEQLEQRVFQLGLEQGMSHNHLQEAQAGDRIIEEMM